MGQNLIPTDLPDDFSEEVEREECDSKYLEHPAFPNWMRNLK
jgi:hypothetical protein